MIQLKHITPAKLQELADKAKAHVDMVAASTNHLRGEDGIRRLSARTEGLEDIEFSPQWVLRLECVGALTPPQLLELNAIYFFLNDPPAGRNWQSALERARQQEQKTSFMATVVRATHERLREAASLCGSGTKGQ